MSTLTTTNTTTTIGPGGETTTTKVKKVKKVVKKGSSSTMSTMAATGGITTETTTYNTSYKGNDYDNGNDARYIYNVNMVHLFIDIYRIVLMKIPFCSYMYVGFAFTLIQSIYAIRDI